MSEQKVIEFVTCGSCRGLLPPKSERPTVCLKGKTTPLGNICSQKCLDYERDILIEGWKRHYGPDWKTKC